MVAIKPIITFTTVKGRRPSNEDRHNIILNINNPNTNAKDINFFGIYDGHGGVYVSEYLEKNLPLYYFFKKLKTPFSVEYHTKIFEHIQSKILSDKRGYSNGSACLINIMYKYRNQIHMNFVNLGDSRAVIVYSDGKYKQITRDHKPEDNIEKKRINDMGGSVIEDSEGIFRVGDLSLSRSFGDGDNAPYVSQVPDVFYYVVKPETKYVVMACDGLWDVVNNNELYKLIINYKKQEKNVAVELANEALRRGSMDNVSVIVIEF